MNTETPLTLKLSAKGLKPVAGYRGSRARTHTEEGGSAKHVNLVLTSTTPRREQGMVATRMVVNAGRASGKTARSRAGRPSDQAEYCGTKKATP
jgi:hypothetical protein